MRRAPIPPPGTAATCDTAGVVGPIVAAVASISAAEAIKLIVGQGDAAHSAFYTAFKFPGVFGNVASQSMMALTRHENELREIIKASNVSNMRVYMDWGNYDMRSTVEGWDMRTACTDLAEFLKSRGYSVNTQTVNDGYSWLSWRNRTAQLLATFFPKK